MQTTPTVAPGAASESWRPTATELAAWAMGLTFIAAAAARLEFINGPQGAEWPWRALPLAGTALLFALPLPLLAAALAHIERSPRTAAPLALLVAYAFSIQIMGVFADPLSFSIVRKIVESPVATSYYTDAAKIQDLGAWLASFHEAELGLHSSTHPPGPILYYFFWLKLLGPVAGATAGAVLIALTTALSVPLIYAFAGLWTEDSRQRLIAAALFASTPPLLLFFPEFDQTYPILSMALILLWMRAAEGRWMPAALFGVTLFVSTFFAYNLLAIGAFMALDLSTRLVRGRRDWGIWKRLASGSAVAIGTVVALHATLALATGYRPVESFLHALATEERYGRGYQRPYFFYLAYNLWDFFFAFGFVVLPLILEHLKRVLTAPHPWPVETRLSLTALGTILAVDLSGTLAGETARVWLFLQPLAAVPAGLELARLGAVPRAGIFALAWLVLVVMKCRFNFIVP